MIRRVLASAVVLLASLGHPAAAWAQGAADPGTADSLFDEAKQLRDEGQIPLACTRFAQSQKLALGVGVTLHLADCYERLGRTGSAWIEFRMAEKLARERHDKREAVARSHLETLEPRLSRLTLAVAPGLRGRWEVRLDGEPVPVEAWNVAWPVDPGDHHVTLGLPGQATRDFTARVEAGGAPVVLAIAEPDAAPVAPSAVAAAAVAIAPPATVPPVADPLAITPSPDSGASRRWAELGLAGAGVLGLGLGAACLVAKNHSMSNGGPSGSPQEDDGAALWSAVGFVGGGAALVSAVVLYLTAPASKDAASWRVTPAPLLGGIGAFADGQF
jgi:hypothetical protein